MALQESVSSTVRSEDVAGTERSGAAISHVTESVRSLLAIISLHSRDQLTYACMCVWSAYLLCFRNSKTGDLCAIQNHESSHQTTNSLRVGERMKFALIRGTLDLFRCL